MNWVDWICFVSLAVLCNTMFPLPFDPVLILFASGQPSEPVIPMALASSICAGAAAALDVALFRHFHQRAPARWLRLLPHWRGRRIYVLTFLCALLPLPFSIVRLAIVRHPPAIIPFQVSVALGRFPRYLGVLLLWPSLRLPPGGAIVLLAVVVAFGVWRAFRRERVLSSEL
jgi:membrane protein YqaA with SNARE-associated domain